MDHSIEQKKLSEKLVDKKSNMKPYTRGQTLADRNRGGILSFLQFPGFGKKTQTNYEGHEYDSIENIIGKILDVDDLKVTVKCLIDRESKLFQVKRFDKQPFVDAVNLEINQFIEINIFTRPGERKFTYQNYNKKDLISLFEPKNYFEDIDESQLFDPLPLTDENNL